MKRRNIITVYAPEIRNNNMLFCSFKPTIGISKFFYNNYFFAEYNRTINHIHKSILSIPILTNILPVAWIYNTDVEVDYLDVDFYNCIESIRNVYKKMYPDFKWNGTLSVNHLIKNESNPENKTAVLFSQGVDSLFSFIYHRHEKPLLITVWGADINLFNKYLFGKLYSEIKNFAEFNMTQSVMIKSNFAEFINQHVIYSYYYEKLSFSWYNDIQHGIGLLGLCSPISMTESLKTIYIPSTYAKGFRLACGSDPLLDSSLKWSNINIIHDGYGFTRQEKVRTIATYSNEENYKFKIHACYSDLKKLNCSKCEKCLRTMIGLMAEGLNPEDYGFKIFENFFPFIKNKLTDGQILSDNKISFFWMDIQGNIILNKVFKTAGSVDFFEWFKNIRLEQYSKIKINKNKSGIKFIRKLIKYLYPIFNLIYRTLPKQFLYTQYFKYISRQNS